MSHITPSPATVAASISKLQAELGIFIVEHGTPRLGDLWNNKWRHSLTRIAEESEKRPEVAISLVGETGAGKSTLVNALLDCRILPVSNMRACTAAISEVRYCEGPGFQIKIDFIPRDSWQHEIDLLREDMKDGQVVRQRQDHGEDTLTPIGISQVAKAKLQAVYGSEDGTPLNVSDIDELREPLEISQALDKGSNAIEVATVEELRERVKVYLDSKHRFWPIVKTVRISGPFDALRAGTAIVDLPGINDPNEARQEVTKDYLKSCRFVWIVFNIKRVLTQSLTNIMLSDVFVRQVVMDGREDALTFVGTASDDLDLDTAIEEFAPTLHKSVSVSSRGGA